MATALRRVRRRARLARQVDLSTLRGAVWAAPRLRRLRRDLREHGLDVVVDPPEGAPAGGVKGVVVLTRVARATCLERSLLLQAWHLGQGDAYEVRIGVGRAPGELEAHAWLSGYEPERDDLAVIARLTPTRHPGRVLD